MKRSVPSVHSPSVAPMLVHANANHEPNRNDRKPRRSSPAVAFAAGAAVAVGFGAGGAVGFGGTAAGAGAGDGVAVVCAAAGLMASAGLSGVGFCSDMSP